MSCDDSKKFADKLLINKDKSSGIIKPKSHSESKGDRGALNSVL